jgi:polysaccharide biosynthesis/export protein
MIVSPLLVAGVFGAGCYKGEDDPLGRSWLDPTELGRYPRQPLLVDVVKNLDAVAEGPDLAFAGARPVMASDLENQAVDYTLAGGDVVQVTITNLQGPGIESVRPAERVSNSGNISLPYIGQVRVSGLTEAQASEAIRAAYRDAAVIADAPVTVTILQANGNTFGINGAVARPGRYLIDQEVFRLNDALLTAGNVTSELGIQNIFIIRKKAVAAGGDVPPAGDGPRPGVNDPLAPGSALPTPAGPTRRVAYLAQDMGDAPATAPGAGGRTIIVDGKEVTLPDGQAEPTPLDPAPEAMADEPTGVFEFDAPTAPSDREIIRVPYGELKIGQLQYDVVIKPGDLIYVPSPTIGEYYMGGHVNRPGAYSLTARDITLTQALITAGGLDPVAWPDRCSIRRKLSMDQQVIVRVDLGAVVDGRAPDLYLKADDQVMVGTNAVAPFIAALRNAFRITYGFGFLYDRNFADEDN